MDFKVFLAVLNVYASNFKVLHWKSSGPRFDKIHEQSDKYCDMCRASSDQIAEMLMRLEQNPGNYKDDLDTLTELSEHDFKILDAEKLYDMSAFAEETNIMLGDIVKCIEMLLDSDEVKEKKNIGIKSELEGMYNTYDLELRFLNRRRMADNAIDEEPDISDLED